MFPTRIQGPSLSHVGAGFVDLNAPLPLSRPFVSCPSALTLGGGGGGPAPTERSQQSRLSESGASDLHRIDLCREGGGEAETSDWWTTAVSRGEWEAKVETQGRLGAALVQFATASQEARTAVFAQRAKLFAKGPKGGAGNGEGEKSETAVWRLGEGRMSRQERDRCMKMSLPKLSSRRQRGLVRHPNSVAVFGRRHRCCARRGFRPQL